MGIFVSEIIDKAGIMCICSVSWSKFFYVVQSLRFLPSYLVESSVIPRSSVFLNIGIFLSL